MYKLSTDGWFILIGGELITIGCHGSTTQEGIRYAYVLNGNYHEIGPASRGPYDTSLMRISLMASSKFTVVVVVVVVITVNSYPLAIVSSATTLFLIRYYGQLRLANGMLSYVLEAHSIRIWLWLSFSSVFKLFIPLLIWADYCSAVFFSQGIWVWEVIWLTIKSVVIYFNDFENR